MLTCRSSAKVNLSLDVLARRTDGYHELQSVVHTVGLWDVLTFEFDLGPGFSLRCNDPGLSGENNLCLKAAHAWLEAARARRPVRWIGLRITLQKHIPVGAGLGGGSGNAAATLLALNRHFGDLLDEAALHTLAASLGADVPLFLRGGGALMEGIGERLTPLPAIAAWLVIAQPPQTLDTPQVYRKWDELGHTSSQGTAPVIEALRGLPAPGLASLARGLHNDLSRAAQACGVDIETPRQALLAQGALGAAMTGSGSAVFGLFESEAAARRAAAQLARQQDIFRFVQAAPLCAAGVEFSQ